MPLLYACEGHTFVETMNQFNGKIAEKEGPCLNIIERISQTEIAKSWRSQLMTTGTRQLITGLSGSAKNITDGSALYKRRIKKIVIAVPNLYYANQLVDDF